MVSPPCVVICTCTIFIQNNSKGLFHPHTRLHRHHNTHVWTRIVWHVVSDSHPAHFMRTGGAGPQLNTTPITTALPACSNSLAQRVVRQGIELARLSVW